MNAFPSEISLPESMISTGWMSSLSMRACTSSELHNDLPKCFHTNPADAYGTPFSRGGISSL